MCVCVCVRMWDVYLCKEQLKMIFEGHVLKGHGTAFCSQITKLD